MALYPLKFTPRYVEKMWGGRKIESVLGKRLPAGQQIGESWELYDFPPGVVGGSKEWVSSEIANGPLSGRSLHWALQEFGSDLLGDVPPAGAHGQFPLLIKFLDAREDLSVQVHPDDAYCASNPSAHLKTEAWYVMQHDPGARLFKGLRPGTTPGAFRTAIDAGVVEQYLMTIPARSGDCHYLPSGTVHALGAGMLVAEVQTPSDTTFRVYDFNRVDPSIGTQRTLHVEQAMACIDFDGRTSTAESPALPGPSLAGAARLVHCSYFRIEKARARADERIDLPAGHASVWIMLEGRAEVHARGMEAPLPLARGETLLVPAAAKHTALRAATDGAWLHVTFPVGTRG